MENDISAQSFHCAKQIKINCYQLHWDSFLSLVWSCLGLDQFNLCYGIEKVINSTKQIKISNFVSHDNTSPRVMCLHHSGLCRDLSILCYYLPVVMVFITI